MWERYRLRLRSVSFCLATRQSPGLPEILAAAYNPEMCLLTLPVIVQNADQLASFSLMI